MFSVGYTTGLITDPTRPHWRTPAPRPIHWSAWYPTDAATGAPPPEQFFDAGRVLPNAPLTSEGLRPLILLSHGTGGVAESLGWLARPLAEAGYVVIGANHHGNTGLEPFLPEGFLCWWERATDLSVLLTTLGGDGVFAGRIDLQRVSVVGFSLGGYTALALAGARTSLAAFAAWQQDSGMPVKGPKEFPDVQTHMDQLEATSPTYRASLARQGDQFSDPRIRSHVAIAPGPTVRGFLPDTITQIERPVTLISGGADTEAPVQICGDWLVALNPKFQHHMLGADVGHYTFLSWPQDRTLIGKTDIFSDHPKVDRDSIQAEAVRIVKAAVA